GPTGSGTRSRRSAGRFATSPTAFSSSASVQPDLVYGRRAVREALRGRREVLELWATERAAGAEPWLGDAKPKLRAERELSELAGTRDHQGAVARGEPDRHAHAYEPRAAAGPPPVALHP